jgi:hypothetical protein
MKYTPTFTFNKNLAESSIAPAASFIQELDEFAAIFQPADMPPLSMQFMPLLSGQEAADSETGQQLIVQLDEKCAVDGYRATKADVRTKFSLVVATAMHCVAEALQAKTDIASAAFLRKGCRLIGFAAGMVWSGDNALLRAEFSQKGGEATKAAFQPRKRAIFDWCEQNFHKYKSVSSAAQVASRVVPMAVKTAVKYINEWKSMKN